MPDNLGITQPQDADRINLSQQWEITYWCNKFGCTEAELRAAVSAVGDSASAVEEYLK